jgi:CRP/FNR family transcriptional regulator
MTYLEAFDETANLLPVAPQHDVSEVPPGGLDQHISSGSVRLLKAKEHLFAAGDARTHLYRVESGTVCLYKIMPDGRRQVIDFAFGGDYLGLGQQVEHTLNAQALEPVRLKCIPVGTMARLAQRDPRLALKLYEAISAELAAAQDHIFTVGQRSAAERVASFLLALARRQQRKGQDASTLVLPMTRADIADFLGLTIETISRTLTKLKAARFIDLEQCTLIRLLDTRKLEGLANGGTAV